MTSEETKEQLTNKFRDAIQSEMRAAYHQGIRWGESQTELRMRQTWRDLPWWQRLYQAIIGRLP